MKEGEIEAECGNAHCLLVDVHAGDLVAKYLAKLRPAYPLSVLFRAEMSHHAPERLHKEDSRAACGINHARFFRKDLRRKRMCKNKLDQSGWRVMRTLILILSFTLVVKLFIDRANEFDWYHVESVREEKQFFLTGRASDKEAPQLIKMLLLDAITL